MIIDYILCFIINRLPPCKLERWMIRQLVTWIRRQKMGMTIIDKCCQTCEHWQQLGDSSDGKCLYVTDYEAYRKFSNYCKAYKGVEDGNDD